MPRYEVRVCEDLYRYGSFQVDAPNHGAAEDAVLAQIRATDERPSEHWEDAEQNSLEVIETTVVFYEEGEEEDEWQDIEEDPGEAAERRRLVLRENGFPEEGE